MARRKVILPNWSVSKEMAQNREGLETNFSGLTVGELVINTTSGITSLATLDDTDTPVIFESSAMIDKRLEGFLDKVHQHANKDVLDSITSGMVESWNNAEANAVSSSKTYTDGQIKFVLCGATEAFDTLKEVEEWINGHSGKTGDILEDINGLKASAHTHSNKALLDTYTQTEANLADAVAKKHEHDNKAVLDSITSDKVTQWDAAEPNVITEISAVTKDNSNVISVNGKKVTIDLTNVGDENVIETIKVNNSALTVSNKTVNVDLSYLEQMINNIELTPGPKGDDGITPVFTAVTANVNNATGVPYVSVTSAKTDGEKYALTFDFQNLKGEKGDRGDDGTSVKILGTKQSYDELPSSNNVNGDGYIIGENLYVWNGSTWVDVGQIKGPQGETGVGIAKIERTMGNGAAGSTDTYTITYTDNSTSTFTVYNGADGSDGLNGKDGVTPVFSSATASITNTTGTPQVTVTSAATGSVYSLNFAFSGLKGVDGKDGKDGTSVTIKGSVQSESSLGHITSPENGDGYIIGEDLWVWNGTEWKNVGKVKGPQGETGVGIAKIERTAGNGAAGTTDTYTITYTDDSTSTFTVYNGADGTNGKDGATPVFSSATATITDTTGTPQVAITSAATGSVYSLSFAFSGLKGADGVDGTDGKDGATPVFSSATASITNTTGTPKVTVTSASTGSVYSLKFAFSGLKGANGSDGVTPVFSSATASITDTTGTPQVAITSAATGSVYSLDFAFSGLKGANGTDGKDGATPVFSSATASITDTTGTPQVAITSAATGSVYSLDFAFSGLKGADGTNGKDGERGYGYFSTTSDNLTSESTFIDQSYVNNSGNVRTNDYIVSREGEVFRVTGSAGSRFYLSYVTSFKGPQGAQGAPGTFDSSELDNYVQSSELNNYVQTGDTKYLNTNAFGVVVYGNNAKSYSADSSSDTIYLREGDGISLSGSQGVLKEIFINVKTGNTADSVAVGNHNHDDVYVTQDYFNKYDFGTTVTQSTGSSTYYLLGVTNKSASTVTQAYVSSTDIYMQGGEIYAASDETLKNFGENIEVDFDKLAEIPKVYYTWKTDVDNKQQIGTSAQKLREIYPELVSESEDGKLAVSYEKLSVIALSAVDKLHKENEELKERLRKIEEKLGL